MFDVTPERWLPVVGWEEFYLVSDWGRIRSLPRAKGRYRLGGLRKLYIDPQSGYAVVTLSGGGKRSRPLLVHCLVAEAFIGPRPEGKEVRHLDGHPANNWLKNLKYGTHGENELDKLEHGTHHWANKTHCPKGHEYTPENTYIIPGSGSRACKQCWRVEEKQPHYQTLKTHCPQGHEYTEANTILSRGKRSCRTCVNERARAKHAAEKGAPVQPYGSDRTTCKRGHELTEENTYVDARGVRVCRTCRREWQQAKRAAARMAA